MRIVSTALTAATAMAAIGLICGVLYSFGGFFYDLFTTGLNRGTALAFGALVGMPAIFGACGFVLGALVASIAISVRKLMR